VKLQNRNNEIEHKKQITIIEIEKWRNSIKNCTKAETKTYTTYIIHNSKKRSIESRIRRHV